MELSNAGLRARAHRLPLGERKRRARRAARERIAARTSRPLRPEQRAFDPTDHGSRPPLARLAAALAHLAGSAGLHGALIGVAILVFGIRSASEEHDRRPIAIEVHEHEVEQKVKAKIEPKVEPKIEQKVEPKTRPKTEPKVEAKTEAKVEPKTKPPEEKAPPKHKPRRVVGLNMESTVQGGDGPSFAAGNTRSGETAGRATDPNKVEPGEPGDDDDEPAPPSPNKKATRIPTAGAKLVLPKRKKPVVPAYPPELKAQGIEADVPVLVSIDATGKVTRVKILKKTPYPKLDEAARKAALAEEFEPATRNGKPIPYTLSYRYRFRVQEE